MVRTMKLQSRDVDLLIKEDWTLGGDVTHLAIKDGTLPTWCNKHNIKLRDVKLVSCPPVCEVCIYINGVWSGYWGEEPLIIANRVYIDTGAVFKDGYMTIVEVKDELIFHKFNS